MMSEPVAEQGEPYESPPIRVSRPVKRQLDELKEQMQANEERLRVTYDDVIRKLLACAWQRRQK